MELNTTTLAILAALSAVFLAVLYGFHPVNRWRYRHIKGPPPLWYAGNLPAVVRESAFKFYLRGVREYGKVFKVWLGATPVVVVADADLGRAVNLRNPNRHMLAGPSSILPAKDRKFDQDGILMVQDRAYHRSIRNVWYPAFFSESLEGFSAHMNEGAERLIRRLAKAAAREQEIDIWIYLGRMTMDVVGVSSFGVEFGTQDDEADASTSREAQELVTAAQTLFRLAGATASLYVPVVLLCPPLLPLVRALAAVWPDAGMRTAVAARETIVRTCANLLRKVREADVAQPGGVPSAKPAKRGVLPGSFLHHLAHARHHPTFREGALLTDAEIISQAFSFLLGGYETTASSLGFTIYNLSANPDKAAKLTEELDAFGRDRVPVNADLEHLPYTVVQPLQPAHLLFTIAPKT